MTFIDQITVLILTWNEEANLERTLDALARFSRIVVLDSGSSDGTLAIAARHASVRVAHRAFDTHAAQWNFGLAQCGIDTDWVLALDADYVLSEALVEELGSLRPAPEVAGYSAKFRYCMNGEPLSGSLYPPVIVLYRRACASYVQDGHTQRVQLIGEVRSLRGRIDHDDRKPLARWLTSQDRYAVLECAALRSTPWGALGWQDRLRRLIVVTPWLVPLYCLLFKRGLLDGRAGLMYALQRGIAEAVLSVRLLDAAMCRRVRDR